LIAGNAGQIVVQLLAIVIIGAYSFILTLIIAKVIDMTIGLRVEDVHEVQGLDLNQHEESGYRLS